MISLPLPHISWFFSAPFSLLVARQLYLAYRKSKDENLRYFLATFTLLGIFFLPVSLPGLISNQPKLVQIIYILSWLVLFPVPFYVLKILSGIWNLPRLKKYSLRIAFFFMALSLFFSSLYFSPAKIEIIGNYWYWASSRGVPIWLEAGGGGLLGLLTLLVGASFVIEGYRSQKSAVRTRSFLVGGGMITLFLGLMSSFVLFILSPIFVILSGLLSLAGIAILYLGVLYKKDSNLKG